MLSASSVGTPEYAGISTRTSAPRERSAAGSEADTSARPPVLLQGVHSDVTKRTRRPLALISTRQQKARRRSLRPVAFTALAYGNPHRAFFTCSMGTLTGVV